MLTNNMKIKGNYTIKVFDKDGNLKDELKQHNLVVNSGIGELIKFIGGKDLGAFVPNGLNWIELGSGDTKPASGDTGLVTSVRGAFIADSQKVPSGNSLNIMSVEFNRGVFPDDTEINEVGLYFSNATDSTNQAPTKILFARSELSRPVELSASDSTSVNWEINFMDGS